jgi:hypothetical protein
MSYQTKDARFVTTSIHEHGMVLFDTACGRIFSTNRTGSRIWQQLEQRASLDAIALDLCAAYGRSLVTAREHPREFLTALQTHGLIERMPA